MKKIVEILQKHPLIITGMFIITLLSAMMSIILGWAKFYSDFLSININIPVWAFILFIVIAIIIYIFRPTSSRKVKELETIEGKKFGVQPIEVDGKRFVNCEFDGSELVFRGENVFSLESNRFNQIPRFRFEGKAANTVSVLKTFNNVAEFKPFIDTLFNKKN
jgi:hypothetical protein